MNEDIDRQIGELEVEIEALNHAMDDTFFVDNYEELEKEMQRKNNVLRELRKNSVSL